MRPAVLDVAATLSDATRCRILGVLDGGELTVGELCTVLRLPQSTVSRHLKVLGDGGWVRGRRDGTSHLYQAAGRDVEAPARRMWALMRAELASDPESQQDRRRLEAVLAERRTRSQEFFSSAAGRWDQVRGELFGDRFDLAALPGLLDPDWVVADLACGTGRMAALLAPFVRRVVAVDASAAMLRGARRVLAGEGNVELREGSLESLPLGDDEVDAATLVLALHYVPEPGKALAEARRALRPGGRVLVVDMTPHDREELREQMGHVWLGFSEAQMEGHLRDAGLRMTRYYPLPAAPAARGPALFAAAGVKDAGARSPRR